MKFFKKMSKELGKQRTIDLSIEKTLKSVKSGYRVVPSMEIKAWKAYLIVTFVTGFAAALIWGSYMSIYQTSKADEAGQVTLSTSAAVATHKAGENFPVQILLDTAGRNIVAVQAVFNFDKNTLQVVNIDISASGFNYEIKNTIDPDLGQGVLTIAKPTPGASGAAVKVATVNLRALADVNEPALRLKLDSFNAVTDSAAILDDGLGTNVLTKLASLFPSAIPIPVPGEVPQAPKETPVAPAEFKITSGLSLADSLVRLDWSAGSVGNGNYFIERKTGKDAFAQVAEVDASSTNFIGRGLKPNVAYVWRVCQQAAGERTCTGEKAFRTLKKKKIFQPRLTAAVENGKVRLTWLPTYTTDFGIFIQRKVDKQKKFVTLTVINSDSENSYLDESVSAGQKITYQILVAASKKSTQKSKAVKITVP